MPQECLMNPNDTKLHHHLALNYFRGYGEKTCEKTKINLEKLLENYCRQWATYDPFQCLSPTMIWRLTSPDVRTSPHHTCDSDQEMIAKNCNCAFLKSMPNFTYLNIHFHPISNILTTIHHTIIANHILCSAFITKIGSVKLPVLYVWIYTK